MSSRLKKGDFIFILEVCLSTFKTDFTSDCAKALSLDYGKKQKLKLVPFDFVIIGHRKFCKIVFIQIFFYSSRSSYMYLSQNLLS